MDILLVRDSLLVMIVYVDVNIDDKFKKTIVQTCVNAWAISRPSAEMAKFGRNPTTLPGKSSELQSMRLRTLQ